MGGRVSRGSEHLLWGQNQTMFDLEKLEHKTDETNVRTKRKFHDEFESRHNVLVVCVLFVNFRKLCHVVWKFFGHVAFM